VKGGEDKDRGDEGKGGQRQEGAKGGGRGWKAYGISEYPQLCKEQSASFTYNQFSV